MNIAFIPVRGGSKSIPLKNIKLINNKPLVYWSTKAANDAKVIDKVIIATDSDIIRKTVLDFNLPKVEIYNRNPENATDSSSTESVMLEFLDSQSYSDEDYFFLIQATSPLLTSKNIDEMFAYFIKRNSDSCFSGVREKQFHWIENNDGVKPINYDYKNRPRRQDFDGIIAENGACYINKIKNIKQDKCRLSGKISAFELPSYMSYEIDEPNDWIIMEELMKHFLNK